MEERGSRIKLKSWGEEKYQGCGAVKVPVICPCTLSVKSKLPEIVVAVIPVMDIAPLIESSVSLLVE